ncbi:myosin-binding protein 7-like [Zingiber officinale]|nr:myosin-binding protein 7-like [Zingiber officinale]
MLDERDSAARCLSCFDNAEGSGVDGFSRVDIENEAEALASHKKSVQKLLTELEEERSASSSAVTEAMSMILRVQREMAGA